MQVDRGESYAERYRSRNLSGTDSLPFDFLSGLLTARFDFSRALDLGCGTGRSSAFLQELGFSVSAVDKNPHMCARALERVPTATVVNEDAKKLSFGSGTFDLVFSSWMLVEIPERTELEDIFREVARILRKDGLFVFIVNTAEFYRGRWVSNLVDFPENRGELMSGAPVKTGLVEQELVVDDFFWSESDYRELAESAGFNVERVGRPTAKEGDARTWFDELTVAPYAVFFCRRLGADNELAEMCFPEPPKPIE